MQDNRSIKIHGLNTESDNAVNLEKLQTAKDEMITLHSPQYADRNTNELQSKGIISKATCYQVNIKY